MEIENKSINNFTPMRTPTLKGISHLDNLNIDLFPLYITPFVEGVDIIIQHGKIYLQSVNQFILNYYFRNKYNLLIEFSRVNKLIIHCTLKSSIITNNTFSNILKTNTTLLPVDVQLFVTDVVENNQTSKMMVSTRGISLGILRSEDTNFCTTTTVPILAPDLKTLYLDVDSYIHCQDYDGVTLWRDKGTYHEGFPKGKYDKVNISLLKNTEFEIIGTVPKVVELNNEKVLITEKLIVNRGSSYIELPITDRLSVEDCRHLEQFKKDLYGMKAVVEVIELPSLDLPLCRKLIKIK